MPRPLVSCITIFLNAERFFEEAVESVLAQSLDGWELLLVDDGSTDGSSELARRYAERYPERIRYLEHPDHENRGMSASRNLGLAQAEGNYIAFLDADDVWLPHKLERQLELLNEHPEAGMTYGSLLFWHSWKENGADEDFLSRLGFPADTLVTPPDLVTGYLRDGSTVPGVCNLLVKRSAAEAVGGFEDSFRGLYEDQVFYAKIGLAYPVYLSGETYSKYRQHEASCFTQAAAQGESSVFRVSEARGRYLAWLERYLDEQAVTDSELRTALTQALKPYRQPVRHHLEQLRQHPFKKSEALLLQLLRRYLPPPLYRTLQRPWLRYLDFYKARRAKPDKPPTAPPNSGDTEPAGKKEAQ